MNLDAYAEQMKTIREVIREHGGLLTQQAFDVEFQGWHRTIQHGVKIPTRTKRPFPLFRLDNDTPILGGLGSGYHSWASWLDLLQHMVSGGLITQTGLEGNITYSLPE